MTGLTARTFGLRDRGELRPGAYADVTLFDADAIAEGASFARPIAPAAGIHTVLVNGAVVWQGGCATGARPGQRLSRNAEK
jgi:N-acyl-D-amino-acid deacylase